MSRAEHRRVVEQQQRQLLPYQEELDRLVAEAQVWLDRLRTIRERAVQEGHTHGRTTGI